MIMKSGEHWHCVHPTRGCAVVVKANGEIEEPAPRRPNGAKDCPMRRGHPSRFDCASAQAAGSSRRARAPLGFCAAFIIAFADMPLF